MAKKYLAILVAVGAVLSVSVTALALGGIGPARGVDTNRGVGNIGRGSPLGTTQVATGSAPMTGDAAGMSMAYPYKGSGSFMPGPPPFGNQGGGDGLSAYGMAFKEVPAPAEGAAPAQVSADPDLIHSAYADAQKRAQALAAGSGVSLGKLLALSDYVQQQPFFKPCPMPMPVPMPGKPTIGGPAFGAPAGSGGGSSGPGVPTNVAPAAPAIAPECIPKFYLVVWVLARYQLG